MYHKPSLFSSFILAICSLLVFVKYVFLYLSATKKKIAEILNIPVSFLEDDAEASEPEWTTGIAMDDYEKALLGYYRKLTIGDRAALLKYASDLCK